VKRPSVSCMYVCIWTCLGYKVIFVHFYLVHSPSRSFIFMVIPLVYIHVHRKEIWRHKWKASAGGMPTFVRNNLADVEADVSIRESNKVGLGRARARTRSGLGFGLGPRRAWLFYLFSKSPSLIVLNKHPGKQSPSPTRARIIQARPSPSLRPTLNLSAKND
jgi:hypothetical protein